MRTTILCLITLASTRLSAQTTETGTIQSGGLTREYRLYVPAAYTGNVAVPLVLNLHGYTSSGFEQDIYSNFRPIADTANFLLVMPNGTLDPQGNRFWNTFIIPSQVNDVLFLSNLIDTLSASYNIDPNRIYSTGMSNGGFMSYSLACELSDRIAAIASVTGSMITAKLNACQPEHPVPVMEIHGTADNTVPYTGSTLQTFVPIPTLVDAWVDMNHCTTTPVVTQIPDINTSDGCTAEHYLYTGGDNGSTVEHYKIIGGGHTWPGSPIPIGVTNQDISASREIWRFFSQYRLNELTPVTAPTPLRPQWSAFPNPVQDVLTIQSADGNPAKQIRVFDTLGRLRQILPGGNNRYALDTSSWGKGLYLIQVALENHQQPLYIIKN